MTKNQFYSDQRGSAHVAIAVVLIIALIGGVGYRFYTGYQSKQSLVASEKTLAEAKHKNDAGDARLLSQVEEKALKDADIEVKKPQETTPSYPAPVVAKPAPTPLAPFSFAGATLTATRAYGTNSSNLPAYREIALVGDDLWFTNANTSYIGVISPSGNVRSYKSSLNGSYFTPIAKGSDGRVWFAGNTQKIHAMSTNGKETTYTIPSQPILVESMVLGPDKNIWFTTWNNNQQGIVGKITPSGTVTEYKLRNGYARGLTVGADGRVWFATGLGAGSISTSGNISYVDTYGGRSYSPWGIASAGKAIWLLGHDGSEGSKLIRVGLDGTFKSYSSASTNNLFRVYSGPNNTAWFSDWTSGSIGRITESGKITRFAAPAGYKNVLGLTFKGQDIWASYTNSIIKFTFK
ncbi:MAG TPA: hypothetical protein PLN95_02945 [Candidatus Saccharibacteria bacterium]|nr:hypothetical protein [Candidatus Saccharibacteria bacterium]